jgi:hypothetical protein
MKKLFIAIFFSLVLCRTYSQELSQMTFSGGASLSSFAFLSDQGVLIRISDDGKILEWGVEMYSNRYNYYAPRLQPFMGRIDYYGPEADSIFRGRVRNIGTCTFTYYNAYEKDSKPGKLRSIGTQILDYYSDFDNAAFRGKLKFIGNNMLEYYTSFEDEPFRGKLKSIGNTFFKYYSSFDDKAIRGKIKSIGGIEYKWYTSFDVGRTGALQSGNYRQNINGITYILQ